MNLSYQSIRGGETGAAASQAVLKGLADGSGLFMPTEVPKLSLFMKEVSRMSYQGTAYKAMRLLSTGFTEEELESCIARAYDEKLDTEVIVSPVKADEAYYLELLHGSTIALKDMALSILSHLMTISAKKDHANKEIMILTTTSGDMGKAAMAGFADIEGTRIIVFYPKNGVSRVQEFQTVTQGGDNTSVVAVHGNFDDTQTGTKGIFANRDFGGMLTGQGLQLSLVNPTNTGRPIPQVAHYVYTYEKLLEGGGIADGEMTNVAVSTGNFDNILAAYFAKQVGVSIGELVYASNDNKVLYGFFTAGTYGRNRGFILTNSSSMDILISSNLERLIYLSIGCDAKETAGLMADLTQRGSYEVTVDMRERAADFVGGFATQEEDAAAIRNLYKEIGYVPDTHTGVICVVYKSCQVATGDKTRTVIVSTANPYKFFRSVLEAIAGQRDSRDELEMVGELCRVPGVAVPKAVEEVRGAQVRYSLECEVGDMEDTIDWILGVQLC